MKCNRKKQKQEAFGYLQHLWIAMWIAMRIAMCLGRAGKTIWKDWLANTKRPIAAAYRLLLLIGVGGGHFIITHTKITKARGQGFGVRSRGISEVESGSQS